MCLHTKWKNPKVAKRDIIVWKKFHLVGGILSSICWRMQWRRNRLYKVEMGMWSFGIAQGFHSFTSRRSLLLDGLSYDVIAKCLIPKGSLYYKGERIALWKGLGNIVSNQLKVLSIVK